MVLFLVKLLWARTTTDLLPGTVDEGLAVGSISWLTSLKIALFIAVLAGLSGFRRRAKS